MSEFMLTPSQVLHILKELKPSRMVLLGGQAVNLWSEFYNCEDKPWVNHRPFTSEDVDACGDNAQMLRLLKRLEINTTIEVSVDLPATHEEKLVNTGILIIRPLNATPNDFLGINIIHSPLGLSPQEIHEKQCEIKLNNIPIPVLHPIQCIESKAINLIRLEQTARQDKKHLELSLGNFKRYILDPKFKNTPVDQAKLVKRLVDLAYSTEGQALFTNHKVNLLDGIPFEELKQTNDPDLVALGNSQEEFTREIQERIHEEKNFKDWLEDLKNKPSQGSADGGADMV
jgi:hypothetical protein